MSSGSKESEVTAARDCWHQTEGQALSSIDKKELQ